MISCYYFTHRFKRSMLEITSDTDYDTLWKYLNPLQTEKLPDNITFRVVADIHTHGAYSEKYYNNEFSGARTEKDLKLISTDAQRKMCQAVILEIQIG